MNVVSAESLLMQMALWVAIAIALAVASSYFLRPKVRDRYPGGKGRYLTALTIQAAGFMIPIPFVLIYLLGAPIWPIFWTATAASGSTSARSWTRSARSMARARNCVRRRPRSVPLP